MQDRSRKVLDLFSGGGGFSLGFQGAGFDPVMAVDRDEHAVATYRANFPNADVRIADLSNAREQRQIIEDARRAGVNVVIGGPPCQGFSKLNAYKDANPKYHESLNRMPSAFVKIAAGVGADLVVMEEVKTLRPEILSSLKRALKRQGYSNVSHAVLDAKDYGVPQSRRRLFLVASRRNVEHFPPPRATRHLTAGEALSRVPHDDAKRVSEVAKRWIELRETPNLDTGRDCLYDLKPTWFNNIYKEMRMDRPSSPVTTKIDRVGSGPFAIKRGGEYYRVTRRQAAALQSYPPNFVFVAPDTEAFRIIGNSVPPRLAFAVARSLL
tara:strand:+ start:5061 stop:6032 length:972 start_codon:yes stop_codon:yes gene_type:complete